ncbi:hypothetical protein HID58_009344, partial [Brassica napus]
RSASIRGSPSSLCHESPSPLATTNSAVDHHVCLGPESRAPTSSSSSQAWLVVVVQFVFQPAAPDSSSATPVIISVMAKLQIEKLDSSSNGYLAQFAWLVVVVQFVFQPAAPDSSSATPVIISVMAKLQIEKLDSSSNGYLAQFTCLSSSIGFVNNVRLRVFY